MQDISLNKDTTPCIGNHIYVHPNLDIVNVNVTLENPMSISSQISKVSREAIVCCSSLTDAEKYPNNHIASLKLL
jgi:hypothetical protein